LRADGYRVHEPGRRSSGLANVARWLGSRLRTKQGLPCSVCGSRVTGPWTVVERAFEGKKPRRAPTRRSRPGQGMGSSQNGLPRGAKLRSGRAGRLPASPVSAGWTVVGRAHARSGGPPSGRREPRSRLMRSGSPSGGPGANELAPTAKAIVKTSTALRWRRSEANPQGSNGSRERARLLGKGKLWRVVPGTRAAWNKAAKRRGATVNGGFRKGSVRAACAARTVERGKNPEDGTGEGVARLRTTSVIARSPRRTRGTRRKGVRGNRNPMRGGPQALERPVFE